MWELWERVLHPGGRVARDRLIARKAGSYSGSASYARLARRGARYRPQGGLLQQVLCGQYFLVDGDISARSECLHKRDKISDA